ncbi:hypothetical protein [Erythrobacter sp. BLCC-B19]|uniref:hypothetical protein n=1 Tax=Erythrobacter sp. BLCC-B19 TaxID=3025315 RepID=UPI00235F0269|nr:hypothetical protein [Erythrobacter sp. BLCC-B19]WDA40273.1 hypothetical protein PS060_11975 [Erythrobacter sp. BLCC-B19]
MPSPSPSVASAAASLGRDEEATPTEQAFADAVTAVARSLGSDDPEATSARPDDVFAPLRNAGLAGAGFDGQVDHFGWITPRRPLRFLGYDVALVFAEEMRAGIVGCCVNDGVTLILAPGGDRAAVERFAEAQRCKIEPASRNTRFEMATYDNSALRARRGLIALSCHAGDMME